MINTQIQLKIGKILRISGWAFIVAFCFTGIAKADDTIEWRYIGGDAYHTRYSPAKHITTSNFSKLVESWRWSGASFNARSGRSTPVYAGGKLFTVVGPRRTVVAIDPANGETLWAYRETNTARHEYSMRKDHGKGIAYGEVDGRGVVYSVSPAFFLTALDAETGLPLENFGKPVPVKGFPKTGVIDLLANLGHEYSPYDGIPLEKGYITSSSPPIVVNDVIIVGNSAEQGYNQARIENIPGDILAYSAKTGKFLWKFNVIPKPGEFGHETWESDAWKWTGDISSWAPLSADPTRNIVYIPTSGATVDFYGGFRPGDNLFSTSLLALDVKTGQRVWHYQLVHHDIWNYDVPTAPVLLDVKQGNQMIPAVVQVTKQAFAYTFNRETGQALWPILERSVPSSNIPGEALSKTQPFPTRPAAFDLQGLQTEDLIDFTPELRKKALEIVAKYETGPLFNPPLHRGDERQKAFLQCPGEGGGASINGPPVADPETGILYVTSRKYCTSRMVIPGWERDALNKTTAGVTITDFAASRLEGITGPEGLPIYKPPYSRITAIDMNTGEHLWKIPVGETPNRIKNHPTLNGMDIGNTGTGQLAPMLVTKTLLMYTSFNSEGEPMLFAVDKATGQTLAKVVLPAGNDYGLMTYVHQGKQYVVLQTGTTLTALALSTNTMTEASVVTGKPGTLDRVFSKAQVKRGLEVYEQYCSSCHSKTFFPSKLAGWHSQPLDKLFDTVSSSMPANNPGSLSLSEYSDVLGYMFSIAGVPLGDKDWNYKNKSSDEILISISQ